MSDIFMDGEHIGRVTCGPWEALVVRKATPKEQRYLSEGLCPLCVVVDNPLERTGAWARCFQHGLYFALSDDLIAVAKPPPAIAPAN